FYGFPTIDDQFVKISLTSNKLDRINSAKNLDRNISSSDIFKVKVTIRKYLPNLYPDPVRINLYMEGYTQDNHPIIGEHPYMKDAVILGGFSGNGFKISPVVGEIAAQLLTEE